MDEVDRYLQAATRDNTRRSYRAAIEHFEVAWGGVLPTTAEQLSRYLAEHAGRLSLNTLRQRLAALAQWHQDQEFVDPIKAPLVKKVLKGIAELHPVQEKRAKPLQLEQLEALVKWLETQLAQALETDDRAGVLTHSRNKALVLIGSGVGFGATSCAACRSIISRSARG